MSEYLSHSAKDGIPGQTYRTHILEVLRMARVNAERVAVYSSYGPLLREVVEYAATYHDLGKLDDENQKVLRAGNKGNLPVKHWDAGTAHLLAYSKRLANLIAAFLVAYHHKDLPSVYDEQVKGSGMFRDPSARENTEAWLSRYIEIHAAELGKCGVSEDDWKGKSSTPLFMRIALSCLVDADHTDTARHYGNAVPEGTMPLDAERRISALDNYVATLESVDKGKLERNELRQKVYDACRWAEPAECGLIACDSPVGTGKTTAIMAHLLNVAEQRGLRRVFVVLPFTNIIDQSVEVYRKALVLNGEEPQKVVAAHHHKAEFDDEKTRAYSFLWNAPITVTTAVQFFETLAGNHPATLRKLHQLVGSAIFLDEAHAALPAHLWPQAWKWLQELARDWGCYIVMASGSLTRFWELPEFAVPEMQIPELVEHDIRSVAIKAENSRIAYRLKEEPLPLEELRDWIIQLPGPRLVILNTVQSAAVIAKEMANRYGRCKVEHLSTALAPFHRRATIEQIRGRLNNKDDTDWTLVATSCVEAGVDFSFRSAAREMCSMISTIQTAGRANRSGEYDSVELWNFRTKHGELLGENPSFKTSARILADFYRENKIGPEFCKEAMRREIRERNQGRLENDPIVRAEMNRKFPEVDELFKVISSNTIAVVIDEDMRRRLENNEKIRPSELQQKTVNIYSNKAETYGVAPIQGFNDLYAWTLDYDDFIGYMAGVLKVSGLMRGGCCI